MVPITIKITQYFHFLVCIMECTICVPLSNAYTKLIHNEPYARTKLYFYSSLHNINIATLQQWREWRERPVFLVNGRKMRGGTSYTYVMLFPGQTVHRTGKNIYTNYTLFYVSLWTFLFLKTWSQLIKMV